MSGSATDSKTRIATAAAIVANFLISWTILPFLIPPFRAYSPGDLIEVLLWQAIGMIGWPLALLGGVFSLLIQPGSTDPGSFLLLLMYPALVLLLLVVLIPKRPRRWAVVLLHILLACSFAAVWHSVLSGYDFMGG